MALSSLLPLFQEQVKSVVMISHSMVVVKTAVEIINPGQVLVITCDQSLYHLQNKFSGTGQQLMENVMFGGLHIKMAALKTIGNLLVGSV